MVLSRWGSGGRSQHPLALDGVGGEETLWRSDVSGSETAAEQFERGFVYRAEPFGFAEGFKLSFGAKRCADHELFAVRSVQFFGGKIGHCCMAMVGDLHKLTRENSGGRW